MMTKYSIDQRQFNNGESDKITFPSFDQCLLYGLHKLKNSIKNKNNLVRAILIEDSNGRKIVVSPTDEELGTEPPIKYTHTVFGGEIEEKDYPIKKISIVDVDDVNIKIYHDDDEETTSIYL